jgi:hypothetical protein
VSRAPGLLAPRAQGDQRIPWPAGMVDEPDNCCVALRVRLAGVTPAGKPTVVLERPRVAVGPAHETLLELIDYRFGDGRSVESSGGQRPVSRDVLEAELGQLGWIDPRCPLRLERVVDLGELKEFIEALILPFGEREAAKLGELMRAAPDATARHQAAWEYALALERRWQEQAPAGRIPCRYLDVAFPGLSAEHGRSDRAAGPPVSARALLPADL